MSALERNPEFGTKYLVVKHVSVELKKRICDCTIISIKSMGGVLGADRGALTNEWLEFER